MAETVSEAEFEDEHDGIEPPLRTREEVAYYRIFRDHLGPVRPGQVIGRFATA